MKTLKYTNANKAVDVEYLIDLIGDNDMMTVYQVMQYIDGVKELNLQSVGQMLGMPDIYEQTVNSDNSRTKYTLEQFKAIAIDKNLTLQIFEDGEDVVTENELTELAITTAAIDAGTDATPYEFTFEAEGGNEPYVWTTESTLPAGVMLSTSGVLSGTPTETGTFELTIVVTDMFGVTDSLTADLVIGA